MSPLARAAATIALTLTATCPGAALADDKCKVSQIAHFAVTMEGDRATVAVKINGNDTRIWLDSGAFFNFMSKAKAVELGLTTEPLPQGFFVNGIGGSFTPQLAKIRDFDIAGAHLHDMQFVVGGSDAGNGFIGANLLGKFDTEFDLAKGAVNLFRETGCGHFSLAYWGKDLTVGEARLLSPSYESDRHIYVEVMINGHPLRAVLDSGAPDTIVYRRAALRAGVDLASPKVVGSMRMNGVGSKSRQTWIARTQTITIGGEEIRNSPIRVIDDSGLGSDDMLLGVDFLMSHHVFVSQIQRKMYLTYNGGAIFSVSTEGEIGHLDTRAENMRIAEKTTDPRTADEFAGRASGRLARNDLAGAIADYTAAIALAPARIDLLNGRATAYMRDHRPAPAMQDIDAALKITPTDHRLLTWRGRYRLMHGDRVGALADTDAAAANTPKGSLDIMRIVGNYEALGKPDRGLALLDPVIALHRDDAGYPALLNARAWNRALANVDLDQALTDANTAIRRGGSNATLLDTRAFVQLRRKAYPAAIADTTAALATRPKFASTLFVRGLARIASGEKAGGMADIAAARAIRSNIDTEFGQYGLTAPDAPKTDPAQLKPPGGDDESDQ